MEVTDPNPSVRLDCSKSVAMRTRVRGSGAREHVLDCTRPQGPIRGAGGDVPVEAVSELQRHGGARLPLQAGELQEPLLGGAMALHASRISENFAWMIPSS